MCCRCSPKNHTHTHTRQEVNTITVLYIFYLFYISLLVSLAFCLPFVLFCCSYPPAKKEKRKKKICLAYLSSQNLVPKVVPVPSWTLSLLSPTQFQDVSTPHPHRETIPISSHFSLLPTLCPRKGLVHFPSGFTSSGLFI